jgi:ferredoxin-thioredoxin reductase catalytic subunit
MVRRWPEVTGYRLNPEPEVVDGIVRALVRSTMEHGYPYCPCRDLTGDTEVDRAKICPCEFHHAEIERDGYCRCVLFVGEQYDPAVAYRPQDGVTVMDNARSIRHRQVTVYSTPWCYHSRRAKALLDSHDVEYEDVNIEAEAEGASQVEAWNDGNRSVPTIATRLILTEPRAAELQSLLTTPGATLERCTVYMTRWCGHSRRTRAWLEQNGFDAEYVDIEADDEAAQQVEDWNGGNRSVPTVYLVLRATEPSGIEIERMLGLTIA